VLVRNLTILSPSELEAINDSLASQLGTPVATLAVAATSKTTQAGYRAGFKDAVKSDVKFSVTTADINSLNALRQNTGLWSGDYYSDKLEQATKSALAPYFEGVSSTKDVAYDIKLAMEKTLLTPKTDQYWRLFAKQAIVQTRSIGQVSGYEAGGFEVVRVKAIIDDRTSEICLRLNGTVISVRDLRQQVNKWQGAVKSGNKEAAKKAWPWYGDKQASKLTSQSKINSAVKGGKIGSPPYHPQSYDDKTEVFTDEGWKLFKDLTDKNTYLSFNPKGLVMEWVEAKQRICYKPESGKMIHFKSQNFDMLVTTDHDVLCAKGPYDEVDVWKTEKAEDLLTASKVYIPRVANHEFQRLDNFVISDKDGHIVPNAKAFIKFMAYWLSDGSVVKRHKNSYYITIGNRKNTHKIFNDIKNLHPSIKVYEREKRVEFYNPIIGKYLHKLGHADKKYIPEEIKRLNTEESKMFMDAYLVCDGHSCQAHGTFSNNNGTIHRQVYSISKRLADDLGYMMLRAGGYPSFYLQKQAGTSKKAIFDGKERTINSKHDVIRLYWCSPKTGTLGKNGKGTIIEVDYNGLAYCVELEKNHTLWIRRNGKTCISGNCRTTTVVEFQGKAGQKILTPKEEKQLQQVRANKIREPKYVSQVKPVKPRIKTTPIKPKVPKPKTTKLTTDEKSSINYYTGDGFKDINSNLNSGNISRVEGSVKPIDRGLSKLPSHRGNVNRIVSFNNKKELDSFLGEYTPNGHVRYDQYLSTSSKGLYNQFAEYDKNSVVMNIKSKTGKDISSLSRNVHENEVLFPRGSQFVVTDVKVGTGKQAATFINMEEI